MEIFYIIFSFVSFTFSCVDMCNVVLGHNSNVANMSFAINRTANLLVSHTYKTFRCR